MTRSLFCILSAAGIALSGCGSSDSSSFAERAQGVTNSGPPELTSSEIQQRAAGVLGNADALNVSRLHLETIQPTPVASALNPDCSGMSGTSCSYTDADGNEMTDGVSLADIRTFGEAAGLPQPILGKNGVTTFLQEGPGRLLPEGDVRAYGAWLEHGAFAVVEITGLLEEGEDVRASGIYGLVGSDVTGSAPDANARYEGLMVGTPVRGEHRGYTLQGDAELVYTMADNEIDAHFTNISDLGRGVLYETEEIHFRDVDVEDSGRFMQGVGDTTISGDFAGPAHEEVMGTFESDGIVGAFGAIREEQVTP